MSFILDALRKSENSRLRQDHPAVFAGRLTPARRVFPTWSLLLIALLVVNIGLVTFVLLRDGSVDAPVISSTDDATSVGGPTSTRSPTSTMSPTSSVDPLAPMPLSAGASPSTTPAGAMPAVSTPPVPPTSTRDDLLARGTALPETDLNMHVYDANPQSRFVLLNGQRLREGESSREGLLVERITPDGVVLRYGTHAFAVNLQ